MNLAGRRCRAAWLTGRSVLAGSGRESSQPVEKVGDDVRRVKPAKKQRREGNELQKPGHAPPVSIVLVLLLVLVLENFDYEDEDEDEEEFSRSSSSRKQEFACRSLAVSDSSPKTQ